MDGVILGMDKNIINSPLVSIMMTSYNRADLIGAAIQSVLSQTYQNWELLILDDASTDDTATVVATIADNDPRIIYSPIPKNLGITKNRNRGFALAKGKYVAVLDCDDVWSHQDKLTKQVNFLETHPEHSLVGTDVIVIDRNGVKTKELHYAHTDADIRPKMLMRNQFTHSAVLMRRSSLPLPRPYDESGVVSIWEDYDLFLRLGLVGQLANLPEIMTSYRWHGGNISKAQKKNGAWAHLKIIKRYKNDYPNYWLAYIKGLLRLFI